MAKKPKMICKQLDDGRFLCALEICCYLNAGAEQTFRSREAAEKKAAELRRRGWPAEVETARSFLARDSERPSHVMSLASVSGFAVRWRTRYPWHLK